MSGREIGHAPVAQGNEVAAKRNLVRGEGDALIGRLKRRPAGIRRFRIVPEKRQIADVAAGWRVGRNGTEQAASAHSRQFVHRRGKRNLQGGTVVQFRKRKIGHAVADKHYISHLEPPPECPPGHLHANTEKMSMSNGFHPPDFDRNGIARRLISLVSFMSLYDPVDLSIKLQHRQIRLL